MEVHVKIKGFTLIEMLITIVIMGIALSALMSALSTSVIQSTSPSIESKAITLAQGYLDEILPLRFDDQSPAEGGSVALSDSPCTISNESQSRNQFDDVDDYHGVNDQPPMLLQGSFDFNQYLGFRVAVDVSCQGTQAGLSANHLAKRITVTVTTPGGSDRIVSVYRGNF